MLRLLPYLFSSQKKSYTYTLSKDAIIKKMEIIFAKSGKPLTDPDFKGYFTTGNSFIMSVNSGVITSGMVQFGSTLYGMINEVETGAEIETVIKSSFGLKIIVLITTVLSTGYVYESISKASLSFLLWGIGMIVLSPVICNWLAGIFNTSVQERFENHIDAEIKKTAGSNYL